VLWWQGEIREAIRLSARVTADAELGDPYNLGTALMYQAMALAEADEPTDALAVAERLALVSRRSGTRLWDIYISCVKSHSTLAAGDAQAALDYAAEAVQLAFVPLAKANVLPALVEAELIRGRLSEAGMHATELVELSRTAGFAYYLAWGLVLQARLLRLEQNADAAEAMAHEALSAATRIDAKARVIDALEVLAGLAADSGSNAEAVRLFGTAQRARDNSGYRRCVSERDADIAAVRAETGDDTFGAVFDQGYALSLQETVEYARRGRGQRRRPAHGWASLTPAERHVAALVKSGLSNPEIAQRLLCSPRTVQAHLTHIFAKIGVSSRAELAAEAVRQQL
jgi:DNA-binding CsgD family transcriptional regulator